MIKRIAIINKSTVVSNTDAANIAAACDIQISRDVAPAYSRLPVPVTFYASENSVPVGSAKLYLFDNADQAGALGYHDETMGGVVYAKVFAKTIANYGLPIVYDPSHKTRITVSTVVSHEALELFCDPYVDLWADGTTIAQGSEYAYEVCDPVEADVYQIKTTTGAVPTKISNIFSKFGNIPASAATGVTVSVSNFVYPEYFDTATPKGTKIDYMGLLKTPYTMTPNGYLIVRQSGGVISEIFGASYPEFLKEYHKGESR